MKAIEVNHSLSITTPCPYCESTQIVKDGSRKIVLGKKQRWMCKVCEKRFVLEPVKNIKGNTETVCLVMDLYFKGCSLRSIKDTLKQFYGLKIHHETIRRWVNKYMAKINEYVNKLEPEVSKVWHADEQMVNIKGNHKWVWNCLDSETRFLLANEITPLRTTRDARNLFIKAKQTANATAEKIITDGSFAYGKAVSKEFMTYDNPKPHKRYVSFTQKANNNKIERYHGSFRQRDKVMRGFKSDNTAKQYAENFKTYYNFLREHQGLNGLTPAQASGLKEPREWKELLKKSLG